MQVGIEAISGYFGSATINVEELALARQLDMDRFYKNLMAKEKTASMPYEDPVTLAVNAAKPLIDQLTESDKQRIELVITCTESGFDLARAMSVYVHHYLNLNRNCRLSELKHACYAGTSALQMAANFILSQTSPNAKALVITTDLYRLFSHSKDQAPYYEPTAGAGAVAILVSNKPTVLSLDIGANGYYGYEIWDAGRPAVDYDYVDSDLSLLSYLDCCENSYKEYMKRVNDVDYEKSFSYLIYHTPFAGMVKGVHRSMMRKFKKVTGEYIETDFKNRVEPSILYCQRVGNIMSGSVFMALISALTYGSFSQPKRLGIYSYGAGCGSEFYSGIVTEDSQKEVAKLNMQKQLDDRYVLSIEEYDSLCEYNENLKFGKNNIIIDKEFIEKAFKNIKGKNLLVLDKIEENYHRKYEWV